MSALGGPGSFIGYRPIVSPIVMTVKAVSSGTILPANPPIVYGTFGGTTAATIKSTALPVISAKIPQTVTQANPGAPVSNIGIGAATAISDVNPYSHVTPVSNSLIATPIATTAVASTGFSPLLIILVLVAGWFLLKGKF